MRKSHQIFLASIGTEPCFVKEYLQQGHFQRDVTHFHRGSDEFGHIWGILVQFKEEFLLFKLAKRNDKTYYFPLLLE